MIQALLLLPLSFAGGNVLLLFLFFSFNFLELIFGNSYFLLHLIYTFIDTTAFLFDNVKILLMSFYFPLK